MGEFPNGFEIIGCLLGLAGAFGIAIGSSVVSWVVEKKDKFQAKRAAAK